MPCLENTTFAVVQDIDRGDQCSMLVLFLVLFDDKGFWRGGLIDEVVLPFADFTIVTKRRIDRLIAAKASIHVDDFLVCYVEVLCDQSNVVGVQVAAFQCSDLAFCRAKFEKEFLLVGRSADFYERPRT